MESRDHPVQKWREGNLSKVTSPIRVRNRLTIIKMWAHAVLNTPDIYPTKPCDAIQSFLQRSRGTEGWVTCLELASGKQPGDRAPGSGTFLIHKHWATESQKWAQTTQVGHQDWWTLLSSEQKAMHLGAYVRELDRAWGLQHPGDGNVQDPAWQTSRYHLWISPGLTTWLGSFLEPWVYYHCMSLNWPFSCIK
jgi:hypothetical protein